MAVTQLCDCVFRREDERHYRSGHTFILAHVGASEEEENNVHKVRNYLYVQLSAMFGQFIVAQLKLETVQGYLDEIQWRERFGTNPYDTFSNIITDIGEQSGRKISSVGPQKQNQLPENVITMIGEKNDLKYQREYKGQVKRPAENIVQKTAAATTTTTTAAVATPPPPKKPKSDEGVYVILSEYYYAKKEGDSEEIGKESKESFQFKCHFCKKILDNNIRVMKHINCHIENKRQKNPDLSDLTQCKFCFRDFETPFSMQCHIETVHMKMDASTCQICNQAFSSRFTLCAHMKSVHVECEMPYVCKVCNFRASVHQQVIEHFQQVHNGSDKFQCHYCLEVFTARISPVQKIGMTQNFFLHLQKHQLKSQSRKCPACCLVFTNSNNVKMHRTTDHVSMAEVEGVIRMKAQRNEKDVVIRDPHIKPVKMAKGRISPVRKELGSISQPLVISASEEKCLDLNITADTSHLRCIECKNDIDKEHFRKFMSCIQCGYGTHCGKAFVEHMSIHLSVSNKKKSSLNYIKPVFCQRAMFCICGYNSINGNDLVLHLVVCGKRSCYPSRAKAFMATIKQEPETIRLQPQSAFFPPLVVLDADEEESINESFARVQTLRSTPSEVEVFEELKDPASLPKTTTPITNKTGSSSEQPLHMLNVLGLVRKNPSVTGKEDKNTRNNVTILANSVSVGKECAPEEKSSRNGSESVIYLLDDSDENKTVETEAEEKTGSEIKGSLTTLIDVPSKVSQL
ncbi:uncharacterized protein LOC143240824 [Tachypleus tridentatus]|uniref:uncharacterized protein LOC143240824 n=1 Tax=Tachypleus tridentatus TaxID=6853 RepID=UPI003FD3448E